MDAALLTALADANRLRIVELLNVAPRAVGEIAKRLNLRQPQVTKHLQALERAGLATMQPLGQRRIYALRREPLRELSNWLGSFERDHPSEAVLEQYRQAIEAERLLMERRHAESTERTVRLRRTLPASPASVWARWTSAELVRRWWAPAHFTVAECEADAVPGGKLRIVMEEGDGARYVASGRYVAVSPPGALSFELAPLGPDGAPLFSAAHRVRFEKHGTSTKLSLTIKVTDIAPGAAPALAGLPVGWRQLLDKLARDLVEAK